MNVNIRYFVAILIISFLFGCTQDSQNTQPNDIDSQNITNITHPSSFDQTIANQAKEWLLSREEVSAVSGFNTDKNLLLAIKVKPFDQFNEQVLEKEFKKELKKQNPDMTVDVSSDQKIYIELDKIEHRMVKQQMNKTDVLKKYKQITKLMDDTA
ncbi:YhcN/YlaJ family sporulation lipoprotein [Radiobacillus sp. PE A8.2]|uniref:YhcN/YlaJ family sporulation lipoprotein n=1 Tax=Radiobacillus sp. PE A8.2 TaxID=3380349 RepID=UPI00389116FF